VPCPPSPQPIAAAVIVRDGRVLICRRRSDQDFPLKWEFPGGKAEPGEEAAAALRRELLEELDIEATIGPEIARFTYQYPGRPEILLVFYRVDVFRGEVANRVFADILWVPVQALSSYDFLQADLAVLEKIQGLLP